MNPSESKEQSSRRDPEPQDDDDAERLDPSEVLETEAVTGGAGADDDLKDDDPDNAQEPSEEEIKQTQELTEALKILENDDSVQGFFEHADSVYSIALNPVDEKLAVTGGGDDVSYVWDITTGDTVAKLSGHSDSVIAASFSFDGKYVATGSMDGTVRIHNSQDYSHLRTLEGPSMELEWLSWHPSKHLIAAGSADSNVWLWDAAKGEVSKVFAGHRGPVHSFAWAWRGERLVTGSEDGSVFIWNLETGKPWFHIKRDPKMKAKADVQFHTGPVTCVATGPDRTPPGIFTGSADGSVVAIHCETGKVVKDFKGHTDGIESMDVFKDSCWLATGSVDGTARIWDISKSRARFALQHDDAVTRVKWHSSELLLFTASMDKYVRLWDARTGECVRKWGGHQDHILDLALTKDSQAVVAASDDHSCLVFRRDSTKKTTVTVV